MLQHGKHELPKEVIAQERLNAPVTLAKLNFTVPGYRVLGKGERKRIGLGGRSRRNPWRAVFVAAEKREWLLLPPRFAVPHQFQRLGLFFQQYHVTWLSMA